MQESNLFVRKLTSKIKNFATKFKVVAITGPRQSGKSTVAQLAFPDYKYVSLEDFDTREYALGDPRGFLETYKDGAIIDEAQNAPQLFSYMQTHVDKYQTKGQFIITGSQNFLLLEKISQSLAGRVAIFKLLPLSIAELKQAGIFNADVNSAIFTGGYPTLHRDPILPTEWFPSYITTYIERDVRQVKNITDLRTFQTFLRLCAGRVGQLVNLSALSNECGISHNTVKSWLSILEASFIIFLLQPHHKNFNKRLLKSPKLYFYDTGLACSLLKIASSDQLSQHYLRGSLFENMVLTELYKTSLNKAEEPSLFFWRDQTGNEVDCIIDRYEGLVPLEIKSGKTINRDFFKGLNYWCRLSGVVPSSAYLVYGGEETQQRSCGQVIPWHEAGVIQN